MRPLTKKMRLLSVGVARWLDTRPRRHSSRRNEQSLPGCTATSLYR